MKFSVVIPMYNAERCIRRCIDSVISQTYQDYEIIIVDDGSNDNSNNVVRQYNDNRIHLITQSNDGVSAARNKGIKNCKGKYICFLDADDEWMSNHLDTINSLINEFPNDYFYTTCSNTILLDGTIVSESDKLLNSVIVIDDIFEYELMKKNKIGRNTCTTCVRKDAFFKWGQFEEGVIRGEDEDMWYRILARSRMIVSSVVTVKRNRDFSNATRIQNYDTDIIFVHRRRELMADDTILPNKKANIEEIIKRYELTIARNYLKLGNKKECRMKIREIGRSKYFMNQIILTKLSCFIPNYILRQIFSKTINKNYFNN